MSADNPSKLFAELGFAVFSRVAQRVFRPLGALPAWWSFIDSQYTPSEPFVPSSRQPFLQSFLDEAEDFWLNPDEKRQRASSAIWELSRDHEQLYVQIIALTSDGKQLLIFHNIDATGQGWRAQLQAGRDSQLELIRDIARRQQLEIELRNAHQASEKLHQARTAFLANVSHELRTPLTSILGMVDLLQESELTAEQAEYGKIIERSAYSLLRLVNDVLDMSRYEAGTIELECKTMKLTELVSAIQEDFLPAARQKGVDFQVILDKSAPVSVWQDPLRLRQVLNNLIDNAIRFTESGSVTVTIEADVRQRDMLQVTVADTGIGIAREYQEVIFDSFKQVDDSHSREYGGTGLGLAIANKLLNCLGGTLHLESVLGRGSTFTVYVPYRAPVSQFEEPISTDETTASDDGAFESLVVLVAEDNPVNRRYIRHVLEKVSATPIEADNGQQVIDILCEQVVDIVVMDCQMPVLDGLEVTAIIREAESKVGGHLPIIAVTAHAMKQDIDQCLAVGMDEHLSKPFKADQLRTMIRRALKTKAEPVVGSLQDQLTKIHNS